MRMPLLLLLGLAACNNDKDDDQGPGLGDTGWFGTDTTKPVLCEETILTTSPEAGDNGWYWRARPKFFVSTASDTEYDAWILDGGGERIDADLAWDVTGLSATLEWDGFLEANTDYTFVVQDCRGATELPFRTSALGLPLELEATDLVGRTYLLDLAGATWDEPPILGSLISSFFTAPVLLGVAYADVARIDVVGAPGYIDSFGGINQDTGAPTWDFPMANFSEAPFLDAAAPEIELVYEGGCEARVPVRDFVFQGTFSADGNTIGGAVLSGDGDTRHLGCLIGAADDPNAVCALAAGVGVTCEPCADGMPYCLHIEASDLEGVFLNGVSITER